MQDMDCLPCGVGYPHHSGMRQPVISTPKFSPGKPRLEMTTYYTISPQAFPYSWSINNVAFAEVGHTSLAYWQAGRHEEAYRLFKSNILDGMYLGSSPGNIGQVSFYDAARGECYRDFGDPVGVYSRVLIQGLYGILPDAMNDKLVIRPGFPSDWQFASIQTPILISTSKEKIKPIPIRSNHHLKRGWLSAFW